MSLAYWNVGYGQSPDSTTADSASASTTATDPASHRLFWMSTGAIAKQGTFSIGVFEFLVAQTGYTPTDFLQLNASATWFGYWSFGSKFQIVRPASIFRGLSFSADVGFYPRERYSTAERDHLTSLTLASSAGSEHVQAHGAVMHLISQPGAGTGGEQTWAQFGLSMNSAEGGSGIKFIGEVWVTRGDAGGFVVGGVLAGIRYYGRIFVGELAGFAGPNIAPHGGSSDLFLYPFPYVSLMWYIQ